MDDTLKKRIRSHLKANEGEEPQPYLDTNGHLTVVVILAGQENGDGE